MTTKSAIATEALSDARANWPQTWMARVRDPIEAQRLRARYDQACVDEALENARREGRLRS